MRVEGNDTIPQRINDYNILRVLGEGGMGTVYLAEDGRLGRRVAIKTMKPALAASPDHRERFIREAKAAAAVEHDNIVPILHVGESADGNPFIVMPLLQGESLEARLKREPVAPFGVLLKVALDVAMGVEAAHARGLIHRDIKPANVWLEGDPSAPKVAQQLRRCKILDFGLARSMSATEAQLTASGVFLGTPAYMAPEQARGDRVDHRADLFSLGVMLYRMATGRVPFAGPNVMAILSALATVDPPPVRAQNPNVLQALSDVIKALMKKDPEQRTQSAAELVAALRGIASVAEITEHVGRPVAPRRTMTRRAALSVAGPLGLGVCAGGLWWMMSGEEEKDEWKKDRPAEKDDAGEKNSPGSAGMIQLLSPEPKNWPAGLAKPVVNSIGMRFSRIPAGRFMRGSPESDKAGTWDERPRREIEISKDFYLGIYEVTQAEYRRVMGVSPSVFKGDFLPVETVSHGDAEEFCTKLSARDEEKKAECVYRLPTEAEWEYACRGGSEEYHAYSFGDTLTYEQANFDNKIGKTTAVGSYPPNGFGLYDMHGNVFEWCSDWLAKDYYAKSAIRDPQGPLSGTSRVVRGGCFTPGHCRAACRSWRNPAVRRYTIGFRVCFARTN